MSHNNILAVIPARFASTRLPEKAMKLIGGKTMVQRVYEQVIQVKGLHKVLVATDHPSIYNHLQSLGYNVCLTAQSHPSGTDRCAEALQQQTDVYNYVVNIQGDEPFIKPQQIELLLELLDGSTQLATLVKKIEDQETLFNPNTPKVVLDSANQALYFSRSTIPHIRSFPQDQWLQQHTFYKHIGIYAYRADVLLQLTKLPQGNLEQAESLEQLRWLEAGYKIKVAQTPYDSIGIDTPEDLAKAQALFF
jgi:3-deoxy-manno-octulosonate cytidylyltransferase (CMP-KDO synthetase)